MDQFAFDDDNVRRVLSFMRADPTVPQTAVRVAGAVGITVAEAQWCLAQLEDDGFVERPAESIFPFFHVAMEAVEVLPGGASPEHNAHWTV
jgi:hypothetical protein